MTNTKTLDQMTAVELRKLAASYGIKGASKGRKADLIPAIEAHEDKLNREAGAVDTSETKPAKSAKKALPKSAKCEVCNVRRVDRKNQGPHATLCTECFDYAEWENTHSDNGHESADPATASSATVVEMNECPVCRDADPAAIKIAHPKAAQFANAAKAAGWEVEVKATDKKVNEVRKATFTVIAKGDSEEISLSWDSGLYDYDASNYIDPKGCRKVRNTSAAIQIIQASASKAEAK